MPYYFLRSENGLARLTQGESLEELERLREESLLAHPADWHSPICAAPEGTLRESPIAVVCVDGYDSYMYPDGSIGPLE